MSYRLRSMADADGDGDACEDSAMPQLCKLRWAKIGGLAAENAGDLAAGIPRHFDLSVNPFATIGGSLFGRWRRSPKREASQEVEEIAPYSPRQGTYAYESLQRMFKEFDKESRGHITENELKITLKNLNLPASEEDVQSFLHDITRTTVSFDQFAQYAVDRENLLYDTFKELDKRNTGYLGADELKNALQKYRFRYSDSDVASTINKYEKADFGAYHQNRLYDFADFRNFLMAYSKKDLRDGKEVWGRAVVDSGDVDTSFPLSSSGTQAEDSKAVVKHLSLGAVAAAVSRTVTSPLERIKILSMTATEKPASLWKEVWKDEQFKGFLRGNLLNIARIIPTRVAEFFVYDKLKQAAKKRKKPSELTNRDHFLLGSIASMAGVLVGHPLDTLRIVITSQLPNRHVDDLLVKSVIENGGLPTLYKGIVPSLIRAVPYGFVTFTVFEQLEKQYRKKNGLGGEIDTSSVALFGIAALLAAQTIVHPLEVVQRRLQAEAARQAPAVYNNMLNAFGVIVEKEGFQGLYSGLSASYAKVVPATAVSLLVYKLAKEKLDKERV